MDADEKKFKKVEIAVNVVLGILIAAVGWWITSRMDEANRLQTLAINNASQTQTAAISTANVAQTKAIADATSLQTAAIAAANAKQTQSIADSTKTQTQAALAKDFIPLLTGQKPQKLQALDLIDTLVGTPDAISVNTAASLTISLLVDEAPDVRERSTQVLNGMILRNSAARVQAVAFISTQTYRSGMSDFLARLVAGIEKSQNGPDNIDPDTREKLKKLASDAAGKTQSINLQPQATPELIAAQSTPIIKPAGRQPQPTPRPLSADQTVPAKKFKTLIQIARECQREPALKLAREFGDQFPVAGIENVGAKAYIPDTVEVRYFNLDNESAAKVLVQKLQAAGAQNARPSYVIPTRKSETADVIEIWLDGTSLMPPIMKDVPYDPARNPVRNGRHCTLVEIYVAKDADKPSAKQLKIELEKDGAWVMDSFEMIPGTTPAVWYYDKKDEKLAQNINEEVSAFLQNKGISSLKLVLKPELRLKTQLGQVSIVLPGLAH